MPWSPILRRQVQMLASSQMLVSAGRWWPVLTAGVAGCTRHRCRWWDAGTRAVGCWLLQKGGEALQPGMWDADVDVSPEVPQVAKLHDGGTLLRPTGQGLLHFTNPGLFKTFCLCSAQPLSQSAEAPRTLSQAKTLATSSGLCFGSSRLLWYRSGVVLRFVQCSVGSQGSACCSSIALSDMKVDISGSGSAMVLLQPD
jgi:hypothetical protein